MPVCVVAYVTLYVMYMYLKVRNTLWQAKPGSHAKAGRPLHVTPLAHLACRETRLRPCLSGSSIPSVRAAFQLTNHRVSLHRAR